MKSVENIQQSLEVVHDYESANQMLMRMHDDGLMGFAFDLSGVALAGETTPLTEQFVQQGFGETLAKLDFHEVDAAPFSGWTQHDLGFGLHIDGWPSEEGNILDSINFHVTHRGGVEAHLVETKKCFWLPPQGDISASQRNAFDAGLIDEALFGRILHTRLQAPVAVIHRDSGEYPLAHKYRTFGPVTRDSVSVQYARNNLQTEPHNIG